MTNSFALIATCTFSLSLIACGGTSSPADSAGGQGGTNDGVGGSSLAASGGSGSATGGAPTGGSSTGGTPAASSGCGATTVPKAGQNSITTGGVARTYYLDPADVTKPVPLIIGFHGNGGNGAGMVNLFGLEALTAGEAVILYPDGVPQEWWLNNVGWDQRTATTADTIFIKDLIDQAIKDHCIDTTQIYAVGFSWGAEMASHVTCVLGDRIRAGASFGSEPIGLKECTGPASMLFGHGANDQAINIGLGRDARDEWIEKNGCATTSTSVAGGACVSYDGCSSPVWWCEHSGGHEVPAALHPVVWDFLKNSP